MISRREKKELLNKYLECELTDPRTLKVVLILSEQDKDELIDNIHEEAFEEYQLGHTGEMNASVVDDYVQMQIANELRELVEYADYFHEDHFSYSSYLLVRSSHWDIPSFVTDVFRDDYTNFERNWGQIDFSRK